MQTTPVSLLERLRSRPANADWQRFVDIYSPLVVTWLKSWGADEPATADVGQEVMIAVWNNISKFENRAGHFRGWLWTVSRNKYREHWRRIRGAPTTNGDVLADADPTNGVADYIDDEYRQFVVSRAMTLMQSDFEPATWRACWEFVAEGRPADEVAGQLGITPNAVYLAKARVLRRLRQELAGLIDGID
jgi:RNA polymerase sigma-70 factor (ECF subfamily)